MAERIISKKATDVAELYLDLLKKCLTRYMFDEIYQVVEPRKGSLQRVLYTMLRPFLLRYQLQLVRRVQLEVRAEGRDWPIEAETMIGLKRLDNLQYCIVNVLQQGVPGDLIECGVWRGGATIFMRAVLKAYGDTERIVWVADSFQGLPKPDPKRYPADEGDLHWTWQQLAVPLEEVKKNFAKYGLLDDQVRFLAGWFCDTLPDAPISRLAVLRIDADMYQSTIEALRFLYPKVSVGGYVIVDDYGAAPGCKRAVDDFRREYGIDEELCWIDWTGVFWQRQE